MDESKIKYEDLISPDASIKNLITQLDELNKTYGAMLEVIKAGAKSMVSSVKSMSTATSEGRAEIDEATIAADRLTRGLNRRRLLITKCLLKCELSHKLSSALMIN